jgi:uncharacterized protein YcbK (DUF882 family)
MRRKWFLILFTTGTLGLLAFSLYSNRQSVKKSVNKIADSITKPVKHAVKHTFKSSPKNKNCKQCPGLFTDKVYRHERAYRRESIEPQETLEDLDKLFKKGKLVKIKDNRYYLLDDLTYSRPYMLASGKAFLDQLGKRYADKCDQADIDYVKFTITSVTRSKKSVKKLKRGNRNAIENSAHLRGKTLDISYVKFENNHKQLNLFIDALYEMKMEKRCFVKYERSGCLHITVR